ncbi:MAG: DNA cytosine methyltransferase [Desulfurococcales archaeon]|nr:DNA cytosine methyltransferase [Desulfurococcales archaeon]
MRREPSLIDVFSGAGGFSRGFNSSLKHVLAIDSNRAAARTFKGNFKSAVVLCEDVRNISCDDLRYLTGGYADVIIGSPPCEPFTGANPSRKPESLDRLYSDPVGTLVLEFIRIVECLSPKIFVMENVPAIMEGPLKDALRKEFKAAGYEQLFFNVLRAQDYGTPSRRVRVFISNIPIKPMKKSNMLRVWDVLNDLPEPSEEPIIPNHEPPPRLSYRKLKRVVRLRWGESLIRYEGAGGVRLPNLIKLHPYRLAPTVLGSSRFIHPFDNRLLTVREQARLMGFPDDHVFLGGKDEQYNQVGEAVPPPLAKAIAGEVLKFLVS